MTPEEHYAAGERWLKDAERWDQSDLCLWRAAIAQAHSTAALWRDLRRGDPPNPTYLEAKRELQERSEGDPT